MAPPAQPKRGNKGGGYTTRVVQTYPRPKGFWDRLDDWLSRR